MSISITGGPNSEIEAEAQRKLIKEKELRNLLDGNPNRSELTIAKSRLIELLAFYDRIIKSVHATIKTVNKKEQLSYKEKNDLYIKNQEKDLAQAKREKSKFRRFLKSINEKIVNAS